MLQNEVLAILKTGVNVFLTGEPGSGKSYTVNKYVSYLRSCGVDPDITASTGIAATHIGGITLHAWCGIGVKSTLTKQDLAGIAKHDYVGRRVRRAKVLIIDEISMLSADTFSSVNQVCQELLANSLPFGGLQVVVVGDFFQLPPVIRPTEKQGVPFAFRAGVWEQANFTVCYLSEQHRQEDLTFLSILSAIRRRAVTDNVHRYLANRCVKSMPTETITRLFPHNADVDRINEAELAKLPGQTQIFGMKSGGAPLLVQSLKRNCMSPETLSLKLGARVMFTKNSPEGRFVNGTTGQVIEYSKDNGYPLIKIHNGRTVLAEPAEWTIQEGYRTLAKISQFPLRLAWAITVHKSQGMSLDAAIMDLRTAFEYGQGYVALSRVRTLSGLVLLGYNQRSLEVHPEVAEEDTLFREKSMRAQETLNKLDPKELVIRHANFIYACGGEIGTEKKEKKDKVPCETYEVTRQMVLKKLPIKAIADERGFSIGTIMTHLEKLVAQKKINPQKDLEHLNQNPNRFAAIITAFEMVSTHQGGLQLSPVREFLGEDYSFDELRVARLFVEIQKRR